MSRRRTISTSSTSGIDLDVDGTANSVQEINTRALPPGADNPDLNAFIMEATDLRTERAAQRDMNLASARRWLVVNPERPNALGQPGGYLLAPGENSMPYLHPESPIRRRAAFVNHHFWATRVRSRRAACRRRLPESKRAGRRASEMDRRRPLARSSGCGGLVHLRHHACAASGRMAGDERDGRRIQALAGELLLQEPGAGRPEAQPMMD